MCVCVALIRSRVSSACQLILTYQFVFIWLFLTTYWLRKRDIWPGPKAEPGHRTENRTHSCDPGRKRSRTTQWPYYIIIMIMLILLQLIPTPLCRVPLGCFSCSSSFSYSFFCFPFLVSFSHFAIAYLLAFYLLWFHFVRALVVVDSFEDNL